MTSFGYYRARRWTAAWLGLWAALGAGEGCRRGEEADATRVELTLLSLPPAVGDAALTVTLADGGGQPLAGATVRLEGNMNHAGMKPSFADLEEGGPGSYVGKLRFTMAGDWFILVDARLADGRRVERKIDVPGVRVR